MVARHSASQLDGFVAIANVSVISVRMKHHSQLWKAVQVTRTSQDRCIFTSEEDSDVFRFVFHLMEKSSVSKRSTTKK